MSMNVHTTYHVKEALIKTMRLIQRQHGYMLNIKMPNGSFSCLDSLVQIVDEDRVFDNGSMDMTLLLPFNQFINGRAYLDRFKQFPEREYFTQVGAQGYPTYAMRLVDNVELAEEMISLVLVYVCRVPINAEIECLLYDEGKIKRAA